MYNFKNIIDFYIEKNPDIKDYPKQQCTIKNEHYFSSIGNFDLSNDIEVYYWYGFLNADGSLYKDGNNYTIFFGLKELDKKRVYRFAEVVGYDKERVNTRTILKKFNGKIIKSIRTEVRFGSRIMYNDIISQGYTSSKDKNKSIPHFIFKLINNAKIEAKCIKTYWWYTLSGNKALAWLLGLYDGDGSLKDGKYGRLHSGSQKYLNLIARTFDCIHKAKSKGPPSGFSIKESYYLVLGTELFAAMLGSFKNSLQRKRPRSC